MLMSLSWCFYVTNLFTNIPLDEAIDIIINSLSDKINKFLDPIKCVKKHLDIATKHILFWFNGILYKHIEGVAMGCPLEPTLANILFSQKINLRN